MSRGKGEEKGVEGVVGKKKERRPQQTTTEKKNETKFVRGFLCLLLFWTRFFVVVALCDDNQLQHHRLQFFRPSRPFITSFSINETKRKKRHGDQECWFGFFNAWFLQIKGNRGKEKTRKSWGDEEDNDQEGCPVEEEKGEFSCRVAKREGGMREKREMEACFT